MRELKEETGVEAEIVSISGIYVRTIPFLEDVNFVYKCTYKKGVLTKEDKEVTDIGWFNIKELPSPMVTGIKEVISDALSENETHVKTLNNIEPWLVKRCIGHRLKRLIKNLLSSS